MLRFAKPLRRRLAGSLVLVLLFIQLATAAYACALPYTTQDQVAASEMTGMPGCAESEAALSGMVDTEQPGLCLKHCKGDAALSLEQSAPQLPAAVAPVLYLAYIFFLAVPITGRRYPRAPLSERTGSPPLSILHCCYRI